MTAHWRLVRRLPQLRLERRGGIIPLHEPRAMRCECDEPDEQPIGGWWPSDVTACAKCGRPL